METLHVEVLIKFYKILFYPGWSASFHLFFKALPIRKYFNCAVKGKRNLLFPDYLQSNEPISSVMPSFLNGFSSEITVRTDCHATARCKELDFKKILR